MKEILKENNSLEKTIHITLEELKLLYDILYDIPEDLFFRYEGKEVKCTNTSSLFNDIKKILMSHEIIETNNKINEVDEILNKRRIEL